MFLVNIFQVQRNFFNFKVDTRNAFHVNIIKRKKNTTIYCLYCYGNFVPQVLYIYMYFISRNNFTLHDPAFTRYDTIINNKEISTKRIDEETKNSSASLFTA